LDFETDNSIDFHSNLLSIFQSLSRSRKFPSAGRARLISVGFWLVVGLLEGLLVGSLEGLVEGLLVGSLEGLVEGLLVGSFEGLLDGFVDGLFDKVLSGAGVGEWHEAKHESRKSCWS